MAEKNHRFLQFPGRKTQKTKGSFHFLENLHFSTAPMAFLSASSWGSVWGVLVSKSPSMDGLVVFPRRPEACPGRFRQARAWEKPVRSRFWATGVDTQPIHPMSSWERKTSIFESKES